MNIVIRAESSGNIPVVVSVYQGYKASNVAGY